MTTIGVLNGPGLGRLGRYEPSIYGSQTLKDLEDVLKVEAHILDIQMIFFQSNHEGYLVDKIEELIDRKANALIFNPGAYSHTSLALYNTIAGSHLPTIEVHISNIYRREEFRRKSLIAPACLGTIAGLGLDGYIAALRHLARYLFEKRQ